MEKKIPWEREREKKLWNKWEKLKIQGMRSCCFCCAGLLILPPISGGWIIRQRWRRWFRRQFWRKARQDLSVWYISSLTGSDSSVTGCWVTGFTRERWFLSALRSRQGRICAWDLSADSERWQWSGGSTGMHRQWSGHRWFGSSRRWWAGNRRWSSASISYPHRW